MSCARMRIRSKLPWYLSRLFFRLGIGLILINLQNPDCLLCPRLRTDRKTQMIWPPADSFLRACKPTEGQGWVHILCSVFVPEVSFTDATRLRVAEGISTIPRQRWTSVRTSSVVHTDSLSLLYSVVIFVVKQVALSFDAAIASRSTMRHARGKTGTGSDSKYSL